jgi:predicted nucleic acid-binding protein
MIVLDASVVVELLLELPRAGAIRARLERELDDVELAAPHLLDAEVGQVLRRLVLQGQLSVARALAALQHLGALPIARYGHLALLGRAFALRDHATVYDALYVALAETFEGVLLTLDQPLSRIPNRAGRVEWIGR